MGALLGELVDWFGRHDAASVAAVIFGAFVWLEKLQSAENKRNTVLFIRDIAIPELDWSTIYRQFFFRIFGERQFSAKCILRSVLLSILLTTAAAALAIIRFRLPLAPFLSLPAWIFLIAYLPTVLLDYAALYKTRYLITRHELGTNLGRSLVIITVDAATTLLVYGLAGFASGILIWEFGQHLSFANSVTMAWWVMLSTFTQDSPSSFLNWAGLACALITSAWLWLYALSSFAMRLLYTSIRALKLVPQFVDFDQHPLKIVGLFAAGIGAALWVIGGVLLRAGLAIAS